MDFILKLSIGLAVTWLFYWLFLRRLTFYRWNRWFLLVYPAMAFLVPFIDINDLLQHREQGVWMQVIPVLDHYTFTAAQKESWPALSVSMLPWLVLAAGSLIMAARFCWQYLSLRKAVSGAVLLADDEAKLYHVNKRIMPFSFGRSIYLNKDLHSEEELREILRHEFIHVKQRHSLDMLWGELICVLNWYNPFAWLLRNAIRQNLEFIADHQVLANGVDRKQYQYLLLKVTGISAFSVANNFNLSSLKKRIIMMNKKTSATVHLLRFVLIVPVLAILLLAFRSVTKQDDSPVVLSLPETGVESMLSEAVVLEEIQMPVTDTVPNRFTTKSNDEIAALQVNNGKVAIFLKNGSKENYDLNDPAQRKEFEKKFGKLKAPPAPPPPVDPAKLKMPGKPAAPGTPPAPPAPPAPVQELRIAAEPMPDNEPAMSEEKVRIVAVSGRKTATGKATGATETPVTLRVSKAAVASERKSAGINGKVEEVRIVAERTNARSDTGGLPKKGPQLKSLSLLTKDAGVNAPLIVLDGEIQPPGDGTLEKLDPKTIESVTVLKDKAAVAIYGAKANNGVIVINSKKSRAVEAPKRYGTMLGDLCKTGALIIIDGKTYKCEDAEHFLSEHQSEIVSIEVFKGPEKVKAGTGRDAQNAIVIKTSVKYD